VGRSRLFSGFGRTNGAICRAAQVRRSTRAWSCDGGTVRPAGGEFVMYFNARRSVLRLHNHLCMQWYSVKLLNY
jgi:hypothetical protein